MFARLLGIAALVALVVFSTNGQLQKWLGYETVPGNRAGIGGAGYGVDLRAVQGWAAAHAAKETCGYEMTSAVASLERADWTTDPVARRTIAQTNKSVKELGEKVFCRQVWEHYGPKGDRTPGLLAEAPAAGDTTTVQ